MKILPLAAATLAVPLLLSGCGLFAPPPARPVAVTPPPPPAVAAAPAQPAGRSSVVMSVPK